MPLSIALGKNKFRPDPNVKYYSGNRLLPQGIGGLPCHFRMSGLSARGMKYSNGSQPVPQKNLSQNFCRTHGEEWDTQCVYLIGLHPTPKEPPHVNPFTIGNWPTSNDGSTPNIHTKILNKLPYALGRFAGKK